MCGLIGVLDPSGVDTPRWSHAMDAIRRRGPDASGRWTAASGIARFGHTRLAVRDLSDTGAQPMQCTEANAALVFNGEIYNAEDHRRELERDGVLFRGTSDTEVLLRSLIARGTERTLEELTGIFAFAYWNDRTRELVAAVDHAGVKPLIWGIRQDRLVIASNCDAARDLLDADVQLDPIGIRSVLTIGYCPPPRTVWSGLQRLAPGSLLRWSPGRTPSVTRWWQPPDPENAAQRSPSSASWFADRWPSVIAGERSSDRPIGVFLSNGLDSSAIAAALAEADASPLCVSVRMAADDEATAASTLADAIGLEHHTIDMRARSLEDELDLLGPVFDEPQGFSALLTQHRLCEAASRLRSVYLGGDGGDELLAGYVWHRPDEIEAMHELTRRSNLVDAELDLASRVADPRAEDKTRRKALGSQGAGSFARAWALRLFPGFHYAEAAALTPALGEPDPFAESRDGIFDPIETSDRPDLEDLPRVLRLDLANFCAGSILPKVDRASMYFGLEARTPFLDRSLLESSLSRDRVTHGKDEPREYLRNRGLDQYVSSKKQGFSLRGVGIETWRRASERINDGALVRSGVLRPDWDAFIPRGDHLELLRLQTLCIMNAWAESRL